MSERPFKLDINLDDEQECAEFIIKHGMSNARKIAADLGLKGRGARRLAKDLMRFAWSRDSAFTHRREGRIPQAKVNEDTASILYWRCIQPFCECW